MPADAVPPAEVHGRLVVLAMMVHAGPVDAAERALAPFRALAEPLADLVRPVHFPEVYPPGEEVRGGAVVRTSFVRAVDRDAAAVIVDRLREPGTMRVAQLRVLGGAVSRVPREATAFVHRTSPIMLNLAAFSDAPQDRATHEAWLRESLAALRHDDGVYVNFLEREGPDRVHAAYPGETWDRLVAVKRRYDPGNLFRLNQNIPPVAA